MNECSERPIDKAIRLAGSQGELARRCNTSQPRIWQCARRNQRVPADLAIPIEKAVEGKVTRYELRPDLYPIESGGLTGSRLEGDVSAAEGRLNLTGETA